MSLLTALQAVDQSFDDPPMLEYVPEWMLVAVIIVLVVLGVYAAIRTAPKREVRRPPQRDRR